MVILTPFKLYRNIVQFKFQVVKIIFSGNTPKIFILLCHSFLKVVFWIYEDSMVCVHVFSRNAAVL
ncbi:MAG: hypothetical protein A2161_14925 [Candidatus Schekmanbacteria bacterium RBG_13_48_7]|uniref:Uncharacterized protein n=1 Tax=Candidatus Schekmanbacteria bacterium RBG_13_48_7 TaxID=1817878 RepID=A0A1F7RXP2_9BACT|nr:MAG: hypothetical protein A2161_14925 [Candidatus Schekmanbacteria bacterium RBG_13_48_7]